MDADDLKGEDGAWIRREAVDPEPVEMTWLDLVAVALLLATCVGIYLAADCFLGG